jgi:hypothetical protein
VLTPPLTKGQAVAEEVAAAGFDDAGFVNISTTDNIVHGQVKQAGKFSFVRIYESGHEVPFYQPLAALSISSGQSPAKTSLQEQSPRPRASLRMGRNPAPTERATRQYSYPYCQLVRPTTTRQMVLIRCTKIRKWV